jgi:hypothetical protein
VVGVQALRGQVPGRLGRLQGWLGALTAAQAFALTTTDLMGASPHIGFALLGTATAALLAAIRTSPASRAFRS